MPPRSAVASTLLLPLLLGAARSLRIATRSAAPSSDRRGFLATGSGALTTALSVPLQPALADAENEGVAALLGARSIGWDGPPYASCRYGTSTLQSSKGLGSSNAPVPCEPTAYPKWLEGYHAVRYEFAGASFPQGRRILSLRTAGAGIGTCMSLPNVGYTPPAPHAVRFLKIEGGAYEDLAYSVPRRFESFWPQSKVLSVQTNGGGGSSSANVLTPKCFVTGEGCSPDANPNLHSPSSRIAVTFDGPTRRGGRISQSSDVTMLKSSVQSDDAGGVFCAAKSYSQFNVEQELQTFYREVTSLRRSGSSDGAAGVEGRIRVAAFLPRYVKDVDSSGSSERYDDEEAVAIYDYRVRMVGIDADEAASL